LEKRVRGLVRLWRIQALVLQQFYQRFEKVIGASGRGGLSLKGSHGLLALFSNG
jgi:hypothetical protein